MASVATREYVARWLREKIEPRCTSKVTSYVDEDGEVVKRGGGVYGKKAASFDGMAEYVTEVVAEAFADLKDRALLSDASGRLYAFNGRVYEPAPGDFIKDVVRRALKAMGMHPKNVLAVCKAASVEVRSAVACVDDYLYEPCKRYVAFNNGVFDIAKGQLKKFDASYRPFLDMGMDYVDEKTLYQIGAEKYGVGGNPARLWERKLDEIMPCKGYQDALQQFCGALLLDRSEYKFEYGCFLVGSGSNGKSVLSDTIQNCFGKDYFRGFTFKQLFKASDSQVSIAGLRGMLGNFIDELDAHQLAGGDVKKFISGGLFEGRALYGEHEKVAAPLLLSCCNRMPEITEDTWGLQRRLLRLDTTTRQWTEDDKDPNLTAKLAVPEARMAVFHWIYKGYKKIIRNGGNVMFDEAVKERQKTNRAEANHVLRWFDESPWRKPESESEGELVLLRDIMAHYESWCADTRERPKNNYEMSDALINMNIERKRIREGSAFRLAKR